MLIASLYFNHLLVLNNQNIYAAREHKHKKKKLQFWNKKQFD
jgi:hypothetical protein